MISPAERNQVRKILRVTIIGAGNIGTRICQAFSQSGVLVDQVCSRTRRHGEALARSVNAAYVPQVSQLKAGSDVYLLCIPDQHFSQFGEEWCLGNQLVAHTAGTTSMDILSSFTDNYGVFYPLQTFSRDHKLSFSNIPVCIESNTETGRTILADLAQNLTHDVRYLSSEQRRWAHLAAVVASNFSNYMYQVAEDILQSKGLDFELIHPLILETARKAGRIGPGAAQTGPATRGDLKTIGIHKEMLHNSPGYQALYQQITELILAEKNKKKS